MISLSEYQTHLAVIYFFRILLQHIPLDCKLIDNNKIPRKIVAHVDSAGLKLAISHGCKMGVGMDCWQIYKCATGKENLQNKIVHKRTRRGLLLNVCECVSGCSGCCRSDVFLRW